MSHIEESGFDKIEGESRNSNCENNSVSIRQYLKRFDVSLHVALLLFPLIVVSVASLGFLIGIPIDWRQGVASFTLSCVLCLLGGSPLKDRLYKAGMFVFSIIVIIAISSLSVMYTNADAEVYHRSASMLLARGWNPVFDSTPASLIHYVEHGIGFRMWHVAYLPRAGWIFGAALYRLVGFVEVADSLNILAFILSVYYISIFTRAFFVFSRKQTYFLTALLAFSPTVAAGLFGGSFDSAYYSFFMIALVSASLTLKSERIEYLVSLCVSLVLMTGIKYTGIIAAVLLLGLFAIPILLQWLKEPNRMTKWRNWMVMSMSCVLLMGVVGFSPYITSWVRHGGPFYPLSSFDNRVALDNKITYDFGQMNNDARQMGYFGRFSYAYLSEKLTCMYYKKHLHEPVFSPDFGVSGGVGGFGKVFRFWFILSLIVLPFTKTGRLKWGLFFIMATVLIQPTYYSGYARYVSQFYVFPLLVLMSYLQQLKMRLNGVWFCSAIYSQICYSIPILTYPLSFMALQWIISVQNLYLIRVMQTDPSPRISTQSYYSFHSLQDDYGIAPFSICAEATESNDLSMCYSSYFSPYVYFAKKALKGFPVLNHQVSGNNKNVISARNRHNYIFFVHTFLPEQILKVPGFIGDVAALRLRQFHHMWTEEPKH